MSRFFFEEEQKKALLEAAHTAWPSLELDDRAFVAYAAERAESAKVDDLRPGDLFIAFGCATGHTLSLRTFTENYDETIAAVVRRFAKTSSDPAELRQLLLDKLFVGTGNGPKIAHYAGTGFLQNWIRVTAARTFIDHMRGEQRRDTDGGDALLEIADGSDDVELSFLKRHYREHFKASFAEALQTLNSRERNALRHAVVQGLSVDQIAALYGVHRATAARRVDKARKALLSTTRQALMTRLAVDPSELESIMGLINSRVDVSIRRLLGSTDTR